MSTELLRKYTDMLNESAVNEEYNTDNINKVDDIIRNAIEAFMDDIPFGSRAEAQQLLKYFRKHIEIEFDDSMIEEIGFDEAPTYPPERNMPDDY